MSPERMARLALVWVRFYTWSLPRLLAQRRTDEIRSDLHEQVAAQRAAGTGDHRIAFSIMSRLVRGMPADTRWRAEQLARSRSKRYSVVRSAARIIVGVLVVLLIPMIATLLTDGEGWSVGDFILAGAVLAAVGVALELAVRRAGNLAVAIGFGVAGVAAGAWGQADDAPGLILLGAMLIAGGAVLAVRRRSAH